MRDIRIHDHNFNFMTLGLYGPGYQTEVWEYDHEGGRNLVGTAVPVRNRRMLPPSSLSVSLNIMELAEPASQAPAHLLASCVLNPPLVQHLAAVLAGSPPSASAAQVLELAGEGRDADFTRRIVAPAMALLKS